MFYYLVSVFTALSTEWLYGLPGGRSLVFPRTVTVRMEDNGALVTFSIKPFITWPISSVLWARFQSTHPRPGTTSLTFISGIWLMLIHFSGWIQLRQYCCLRLPLIRYYGTVVFIISAIVINIHYWISNYWLFLLCTNLKYIIYYRFMN